MKDKITAAEYREMHAPGKAAKKKSKYSAIKTTVDDVKFDSKKEAARYGALKILNKARHISKPIMQYEFSLGTGISYRADFVYFDYLKREWIVEDVKGMRTPEYKLKKKLLEEQTGIKIKET